MTAALSWRLPVVASAASTPMPHILVVEDEEHLAIGIKYNLEAEGFTVTTAGNGQAALAAVAAPEAPVDLVVLDLMLPGMSGYAVCEAIREQGSDMPVVMLTARTLVEDRIRGFDAGTDVYLQKPFDLDELLSIVRNLLARRGRNGRTRPTATDRPVATDRPAAERAEPADDEAALTAGVYRFGNAEVNFDTWEARSGTKPVRLTNLEMKLLRYLVEHEGTVSSRSDLLKRVWGMARAPATRTVDTFMLNLRKYFEADPARPVHFLSVRGMGYRFVKDKPAVKDKSASPAEKGGGSGTGVGASQE
jgi:two-component system, OmpR family, alkaline phosphatase synthesis response regulator PhoP